MGRKEKREKKVTYTIYPFFSSIRSDELLFSYSHCLCLSSQSFSFIHHITYYYLPYILTSTHCNPYLNTIVIINKSYSMLLLLLLMNEHKHFNRVEVKNKNSIYIQQQKRREERKNKKVSIRFYKATFCNSIVV